MSGFEAPIIISLVAAAASTAVQVSAARSQNRALRRSQESAQKAATVQSTQVRQAASLERQKEINRAQIVRARIRAAAAEAGFEDAGTYQQLQDQANQDAAINTGIVRRNAQAQLDRVASGLDADFTSLQGRMASPLLAAFSGGLEGAQRGLAIYGGLSAASAGSASTTTGQGGTAYTTMADRTNYGNYTGRSGAIA